MDQSTCADEESVFRVKVPNYTMYGRRAKIAAIVIGTVWATWCPGCREEIASMQRMYASYAARGFRVVAVSIDRGSDAEISAFAHSLGLTFDIVRDDGDILTLDEPEPPASSAVKK